MLHELKARDGRRLTLRTWGDTAGVPVFLLHGTPGSGSGPRPRSVVLHRLGIRLICPDRPGYGGSERFEGRSVADAAADVAAIADHLGIERFRIVGRSGGGPHALACAALLNDRIDRAAALVSLAPPQAEGLAWYDGMTGRNVSTYVKVDNDAEAVTNDLVRRTRKIQADPEYLLESLLPGLAAPDLRVVDDVAIRRLLAETYAEGLRDGADGWIDDVLALRRSWEFDLLDIIAPVLLWHGGEDKFSPVSHTYWLEKQLANARPHVVIEWDAAHFAAVEILPKVLAWVAAPAGDDRWPRHEPTRSRLMTRP